MITFIVNANIKPGATAELQDAVARTADYIAEHAPGWATYVSYDLDAGTAYFVNIVNDSDALTTHFALAADNPAHPEMMAACEVTSVEICGNLSPEAEATVAAMNPHRREFDGGTFDRRIAPC